MSPWVNHLTGFLHPQTFQERLPLMCGSDVVYDILLAHICYPIDLSGQRIASFRKRLQELLDNIPVPSVIWHQHHQFHYNGRNNLNVAYSLRWNRREGLTI
ncbi:hypothetical protein TNCV_2395001 [Trichonephila clavipes]|nr:hypothetical protein TNCV_2395001 [Trichonephila clavipes]